MAIGWILGVIFTFATLVFIAICFFFPEWVGITGKKAQQTIKDHQGDPPAESSSSTRNKE